MINNFENWTAPLGWTLVNSLWQAGIISLLVILILRILPQRFSKVRYAIACAGISAAFLVSLATFIILANNIDDRTGVIAEFAHSSLVSTQEMTTEAQSFSMEQTLAFALGFLDQNMRWILTAWAVGALVFSLRLVGGWWFISTLKSESTAVAEHWNEQLQTLAENLGIQKIVQLAESTRITTPMVIGFFKPMVLVPAGMLAGLSPAQIETIFLHELAHIRRHDYIINLAQTFIETLFFFNPFVWILSNVIRREREYCCDDDVIRMHGSSLEYAKTLAKLEEWKLTRSTFALALAANKNQLLHRIKRIMEKTGEKYSAKDRLVPAALLIVGLVCASWLTVQKKNSSSLEEKDSTLAQDTTVKKSRSSRTTIITFDEKGEPHEQVFEEFSGDSDFAFEMPVPPVPPTFEVPAVPSFPNFPAFPSMPADVWTPDTIPGAWYHSGKNWEEFSREFEKKFSEEFSDFYKKNQKEFDKMMKAMEEKFKADFDNQSYLQLKELDMQHLNELVELQSLAASQQHMALEEMNAAQHLALSTLDEIAAVPFAADLHEMSADLELARVQLDKIHAWSDEFATTIKEMAIKDGYLKKDEKVESLRWQDDEIEINGKKVKEKDRQKYHELHDKYFKEPFIPNRVE